MRGAQDKNARRNDVVGAPVSRGTECLGAVIKQPCSEVKRSTCNLAFPQRSLAVGY